LRYFPMAAPATTTMDPAATTKGGYHANDGARGYDNDYGNDYGRTGTGAGTHRPGLFRHDSQPGFPVHGNRRIANPSPLGMFALAATTLMWSLFNARTRHLTEVNAIVGMALAVGGLCQLLAGMWEFVTGNTFAATAFTILAGFWLSYGILYWPSSGSLSAYGSNTDLGSALGIYFMVWMIVALMLLLGTFRSSIPLAATFFFLFLMYLLLGVSQFNGRVGVLRAGGVIGCIASMFAFYTGAVGLHNRDTTYYGLPPLGLGARGGARRDTAAAGTARAV